MTVCSVSDAPQVSAQIAGSPAVSPCAGCGRLIALSLCWDCAKRLRRQLVEFPWYIARLHESAYGEAKLARAKAPVSRGESIPAPPLNQRASDLLLTVRRVLTRRYLDVFPSGAPVPSGEGCARKLAAEVGELMRYAGAGTMLDELVELRAEAEAVIDLPPDQRYVGPCSHVFTDGEHEGELCGVDLYIPREGGYDSVICPRCGSLHGFDALQQAAVDRIDDEHPKTAAEMWRLLRWLGREVPRSSFYALMTRVEARRYRGGSPVYAYSDVVAALDAQEAAEAEAKAAGRRKRGRPRRVAVAEATQSGVPCCSSVSEG